MNDIHTPTVASGPTTGRGPSNGLDTDKLSLMDIFNEKTRVEEELRALGSVLDSVRLSTVSWSLGAVHIRANLSTARSQNEYNANHL